MLHNYAPEVQRRALLEALQYEWGGSLYKFAKYGLGYKDINLRTHGDMIELLESDIPGKCVVMPRGTFKSSVCSVANPIWKLIKDPNRRILLDSEIYTNSKNFLREIKAHMKRPLLASVFGDFEGDVWNEGEITIAQRTKILKEASITCSGIGAIKVGQHYDDIIGDDYNSGNNSATTEGRQKVIEHVKMNMAILEPGGSYTLVGTRYAVDDAIGWALENLVGGKWAKNRGLLASS